MRKKYFFNEGDIINAWTILGESKKKGSDVYYLVRCECGGEYWKRPNDIHRNSARFECTHGKGRRGPLSSRWTGSNSIPGTVLACIKSGARKRTKDISVEITMADLEDQWLKQKGICVYTGLPLSFSSCECKGDASVDRIDSSLGYIKGNIQFVHKRVNIMKSDMGEDEFLLLCKMITTHVSRDRGGLCQ